MDPQSQYGMMHGFQAARVQFPSLQSRGSDLTAELQLEFCSNFWLIFRRRDQGHLPTPSKCFQSYSNSIPLRFTQSNRDIFWPTRNLVLHSRIAFIANSLWKAIWRLKCPPKIKLF
ncbi:hypothetical protein LguiA_035577 [Lonicera macranthoides]